MDYSILNIKNREGSGKNFNEKHYENRKIKK